MFTKEHIEKSFIYMKNLQAHISTYIVTPSKGHLKQGSKEQGPMQSNILIGQEH
jgi:hypothetical protein